MMGGIGQRRDEVIFHIFKDNLRFIDTPDRISAPPRYAVEHIVIIMNGGIS